MVWWSFDKCLSSHAACQIQSSNLAPSRLLELSLDPSQDRVRLIETDSTCHRELKWVWSLTAGWCVTSGLGAVLYRAGMRPVTGGSRLSTGRACRSAKTHLMFGALRGRLLRLCCCCTWDTRHPSETRGVRHVGCGASANTGRPCLDGCRWR